MPVHRTYHVMLRRGKKIRYSNIWTETHLNVGDSYMWGKIKNERWKIIKIFQGSQAQWCEAMSTLEFNPSNLLDIDL